MYCTPSEIWRLALPPDTLFEHGGLEAGHVTVPQKTGSGLGTLEIEALSVPRDTGSVLVKCVSAGELDGNYVNPGPEPIFKVSFNGGTDYKWQPFEPDSTGRLIVVAWGFSAQLKNGAEGAPVTVGTGDAALVFTPLRAGGSVQILVGTALTHVFFNGALTLTVTAGTTAIQAVGYLNRFSAITSYYRIAHGGTGAGIVQAAAKTAFPFVSFAVNDQWSFTTLPSPDLLAAQRAAFDYMNSRLRSSFRLPLQSWDTGIKFCEAVFTRWFALRRIGADKRQDMRSYNPAYLEQGEAYLAGIANGQIRPDVVQAEPGATLFPDLITQLDPLGREVGSLKI